MPSPESNVVFVCTSVSSRSRTSVLLRPLDVLKVGGEGKNRSDQKSIILWQSDFLDEDEEAQPVEYDSTLLCGGLFRRGRREYCLLLIAYINIDGLAMFGVTRSGCASWILGSLLLGWWWGRSVCCGTVY